MKLYHVTILVLFFVFGLPSLYASEQLIKDAIVLAIEPDITVSIVQDYIESRNDKEIILLKEANLLDDPCNVELQKACTYVQSIANDICRPFRTGCDLLEGLHGRNVKLIVFTLTSYKKAKNEGYRHRAALTIMKSDKKLNQKFSDEVINQKKFDQSILAIKEAFKERQCELTMILE